MRESCSDQRESQNNARRVPVSGTHVRVVLRVNTSWLGVEHHARDYVKHGEKQTRFVSASVISTVGEEMWQMASCP